MLLGLTEQVAVGRGSWYNHRIVAACSAGLLAGPGIGAVISTFVTWLAVAYDGRRLPPGWQTHLGFWRSRLQTYYSRMAKPPSR
jgi:hypothetical protein